ncbi:hypothetical protein BSK47_08850 [Paenibacillus odorifer]|uniref:Uncharacterized protein n=1 Tax=Paenibacillus odorifer TaxID=189426 RepID=A0AB36JI33_9BACL|nr:hypothetical protein BSK47_08850 [Paenibacillus odorifer]
MQRIRSAVSDKLRLKCKCDLSNRSLVLQREQRFRSTDQIKEQAKSKTQQQDQTVKPNSISKKEGVPAAIT